MVCLGFEPGAAGWKAQTNPLSYGGTPIWQTLCQNMFDYWANPVVHLLLLKSSIVAHTYHTHTHGIHSRYLPTNVRRDNQTKDETRYDTLRLISTRKIIRWSTPVSHCNLFKKYNGVASRCDAWVCADVGYQKINPSVNFERMWSY